LLGQKEMGFIFFSCQNRTTRFFGNPISETQKRYFVCAAVRRFATLYKEEKIAIYGNQSGTLRKRKAKKVVAQEYKRIGRKEKKRGGKKDSQYLT